MLDPEDAGQDNISSGAVIQAAPCRGEVSGFSGYSKGGGVQWGPPRRSRRTGSWVGRAQCRPVGGKIKIGLDFDFGVGVIQTQDIKLLCSQISKAESAITSPRFLSHSNTPHSQ